MKLFVDGRKDTKEILKKNDFSKEEWLWFHCASLGEYEQAVPLIKALKEDSYQILVSFFSPSGYEQKKNHQLIDVAIYLPIDTPSNAYFLVNHVQPKQAYFVKYEFWENYFSALNYLDIPIYMVSSTFRENQVFFKWYGSFSKQTLKRVSHFFVQNEQSKQVLHTNGFYNVTISGDTRFDRVSAQLTMNNKLDFIESFIGDRLCVVLGSTWPDCEAAFIDSINKCSDKVCFVIAPHEIQEAKIDSLLNKIKVATSVYSRGIDKSAKVLIIDAIGFLTRIYSYADIAYVGGAVGKTGLHNVLEPAVFGTPILVGSHIDKFPEAKELAQAGGLIVLDSTKTLNEELFKLIADQDYRKKMSNAAADFVKSRQGATEKVVSFVKEVDRINKQ